MSVPAEKLPSIAQMKNRTHQGHKSVLENLASGQPAYVDTYPIPEHAVASTMRGRRTVLNTLRRWECIDRDGITERGRALLAVL